MKHLKILCIGLAIFLASLAGGQIAQSEKLINIYQKCFVDVSAECSSREKTEGEMILNQWSGNLRYYFLGCILFLGAASVLESRQKKSNQAQNKDADKNSAS